MTEPLLKKSNASLDNASFMPDNYYCLFSEGYIVISLNRTAKC